MPQQFDFAILQLAPDRSRNERLNVATLVFRDDGLDVRISNRLDKVRALSAAINTESLRTLIGNFVRLDDISRAEGLLSVEERISMLSGTGPVAFTGIGSFEANSSSVYESRIIGIMQSLVEPEPAPIRVKPKRTKLLSVVKSSFRRERVLAKKGEILDSHRFIQNYKLAEGLIADLVLKNGAMHVVETVDFSGDDVTVKRAISDVAVSALVLEQARMNYGIDGTRSKLVYDASSALEAVLTPSLEAAHHQGTELINWASQNARDNFIDKLSALAIPFEEPKRGKKAHFIATTQSRFSLN
jgi:Protein of unknown function (DUF3037)